MADRRRKKEHWGSQLGVVLAVAGSAIGLGNFLRFPGQVARYGGGAFMLPYFFSLLLVAIPLAWTEWALGRCGGRLGYNSPPGIYRAVGRRQTRWGICGGISAVIPFAINMYYLLVEALCLLYALQYLGGCLKTLGLGGFSLFSNVAPGMKLGDAAAYDAFFGTATGIASDGALFGSEARATLLATLGCAATNFWLVYRGVSRGVEKFCKFAAPLLAVCALVVIVRVSTLGNPTGTPGQSFLDGLGFMWNPSKEVVDPATGFVSHTSVLTSLSNPETWLAATSQIFFTVSLCLGAICTYASYVKPKSDIALSGLTSTMANEFCEVVLGGLMAIPPAIMFLGVRAADQFESSFSLGFVVLPNVFGAMPLGQAIGFAFFSLLFLAGITSSISLVQPTVALFQEAFRVSRGRSVALASCVTASGAFIVLYFTKGLAALDAFDFWLANFAPFALAIVQTCLVVFVWGIPNLMKELDVGAKIRVPRCLGFVVKYLSLPYLAIIFLFWLYRNLGGRLEQLKDDPVALKSICYLFCLISFLALVSYLAVRRWKREEAEDAALEAASQNRADDGAELADDVKLAK